jgi:glycerophosphoryl diester phosphodiesterase
MKRFIKLSVIACLVAVMSSCNDNDEEAPYFKMRPQSLTSEFKPEGGIEYFTVSANREFTATSSEPWCVVTVIDGKTEENLKIEVSPQQATTDRQATVTITCPGFTSKILTVTQTGVLVVAFFEVTAPDNPASIAWWGENILFTVNSSETWDYEITTNSSWLTEKAKDATTLTLAAEYNAAAAKNATVRIFLPAYSDVSEEFNLTQMAYGELTPPIIMGHRGMFKTYPENTLIALNACVKGGMGFEFDVRTSKDGELVIMHDDNTARTTNGGSKRIRDLTLAQIKELDAGSWFSPAFAGEKVPALEEVLSAVKKNQNGSTLLAVEIKDVDAAGEIKLVQLLAKYGLLRQSFCFAQTDAASRRLKNLNVSVRIGKQIARNDLQKEITEGLTDVFMLGFLPTSTEVETLRAASKGIVINAGAEGQNPAPWRNYLLAGIDGMIADYPAEFHDYVTQLFAPKSQ